MTYKEDEILFVGSVDECIEYLLDNQVDDNNHLYYALSAEDEFKKLSIKSYIEAIKKYFNYEEK